MWPLPEPGDGDASPFALGGRGGPGVLCLHGFSGTPFEVRPLAEGLGARGFSVLAPALAGHGATVAYLERTRWPDWLASAEQALDRLIDETGGSPVGIAGFSLGGLLALRLARLRPRHVGALAVLSAPLRLRLLQVAVVRALGWLPTRWRRGPLAILPKLRGYDVANPEMSSRNPGLTSMPVAGVLSLLELAAVTRRELSSIDAPVLVAHGGKDRTVPMADSLELERSLGSAVIERLWLPASGHLVAIDVERRSLIEAVGRFFTQHLAAKARSHAAVAKA